jgi:hypothetical protein
MATEQNYEVLVDELTLHQDVRALRHPLTGEPTGYQLGGGKTYLLGEIIEGKNLASVYKNALDDSDHALHESLSEKLKPVGAEPSEDVARRLGLPFEGYADMDTEEIVAAMRVLPSRTIQNIKEYEAQQDDPRTEIVDYDIGFGEHPDERQNTELDLPEPDENKPVREGVTREVPDDGPVQHGEGVTGTGEPKKPFGTKKAAEKASAPRRGRRARSKPQQSSGEGSGSNE